jgi:hypothetical protein
MGNCIKLKLYSTSLANIVRKECKRFIWLLADLQLTPFPNNVQLHRTEGNRREKYSYVRRCPFCTVKNLTHRVSPFIVEKVIQYQLQT